jgi:hypothetical protein
LAFGQLSVQLRNFLHVTSLHVSFQSFTEDSNVFSFPVNLTGKQMTSKSGVLLRPQQISADAELVSGNLLPGDKIEINVIFTRHYNSLIKSNVIKSK